MTANDNAPSLADLAAMIPDDERARIVEQVLAEVLADLPAMYDAAVARHRASGAPPITREEADRRADEAVARATRAFYGEPEKDE